MSLLDYLGTSLNKPGRAVRGLLAGRPEEALAALPFSDTLGMTDEENAVGGKDLLSMLGLDPGEGIGGDLAGIGVDIATDPLTYTGGYLAKRLLGGGFRSKAITAADQVPAEFELGNKYARLAEGGFPGETGRMPGELPMASQIHELPMADPSPYTVAGADATMPGGELIRQLPHPSSYNPLIPVEPPRGPLQPGEFPRPPQHNPELYGYASDAVQDGDKMAAVQSMLGGWDKVLGDFDRLGPEARAQLTGHGAERDNNWRHLLNHYYGELQGISQLQGVLPEAVVAKAQEQAGRLGPLTRGIGSNPTEYLAQDVLHGHLAPSDVVAHADQAAPHLPVDERLLRKLAATGQEVAVNRQILGRIEAIPEQLGFDAGTPLDSLMGGGANPTGLHRELLAALDPASYQEIEQNIRRRVLENPTNGFTRMAVEQAQGALPPVQNAVLRELAEMYFQPSTQADQIQSLARWAASQGRPVYRHELMQEANRMSEIEQEAAAQALARRRGFTREDLLAAERRHQQILIEHYNESRGVTGDHLGG